MSWQSLSLIPTLTRLLSSYELGGPLDVYDVQTNVWTSHAAPLKDADGEPRKRSVHGFVPLPPGFSRSADQAAIALLFFGEGEGAPAELGHNGAGKVSCYMTV